jgi:hypothetical protein
MAQSIKMVLYLGADGEVWVRANDDEGEILDEHVDAVIARWSRRRKQPRAFNQLDDLPTENEF